MISRLLLVGLAASPIPVMAGQQSHSRTATAPVHSPRPDTDPCIEQGTCGQGDHGQGNALIAGSPNCNAQWGEPDPLCSTDEPTTTATTCTIKATGGTPELSQAPPWDPTFEDDGVLLAEAHYYLEVQVTEGTYWLLFWNSTDGHMAEHHRVVCTEDGGEYTFIESTLPVY